jgi:uncharacterized protein (DUF488 family)
MNDIRLFTIGFTKKKASEFFGKLQNHKIKKIIDIRLNNVSQLAGFAKKDDLIYFLKELCDCDYRHEPLLAPTKEILDGYKKKTISWTEYEKSFLELLEKRKATSLVSLEELNSSCLLCSENKPDKCHRRLVSEYLQKHLNNIDIRHI